MAGIAWVAPGVALSAAAPAIAVSSMSAPVSHDPDLPELGGADDGGNDLERLREDHRRDDGHLDDAGQQHLLRRVWLDSATAGYGDLKDLTFTTSSTLQNLTWTVTESDGIGTWRYVGETKSGTTSTYTFVYSGPTKRAVHMGAPDKYYIDRSIYTGVMAVSSPSGPCGDYRKWTNTTTSTLWGTSSYSGTQTSHM